MSLYYSSLNSGSNGNCYYIGNDKEAVLVDVGLSCKEVEKRLERSGLDIKKIKAIFISHEHSDHIRGVDVLSRKYQLPVYITPATRAGGKLTIASELNFSFQAYENIKIGKLTITPFPKFHDAADPHSFLINGNQVNIGVFTDIGTVCAHVKLNFEKCHAIFLEANYDEQMLENGSYPYFLKERIKSDTGHLSNHQAANLFSNHKPEFMSHVLLSHLSKDNNHPDVAMNYFLSAAGETKIEVASRHMETSVFQISSKQKSISKRLKIEEGTPEP